MPAPVTSNPSPRRSSETSNPMRKSFSGNPFSKPSVIANPRTIFPNTPANSPSDFSRRNPVVAGSLLDDKENGKGEILKAAKARSPAASSNGTKNFMAPTISASFKIAESPRKKILAERNEPAPTSVPSADAKTPQHVRKVTFAEPLECGDLEERKLDGVPSSEETLNSSLTSEDFSGESVEDANVPLVPKDHTDLSFESGHDMNVPPPLVPILKNDIDTEPSFETDTQEPDCVNLDPTFKLSPTPPPASSTVTILAPLDADPFVPPYDPKTNYLSPRPQFLHYKPKPRMELCNGSIMSGSSSDSEFTEDTQSESSQKESEDVSSDEIAKEEESQNSEPVNPARTFMPDETFEAKEAPKFRFSMRSKAIGLILLLSVAFLSISVTNSPGIDRAVLEDLYETYGVSEFSEFARANFDRFSQVAKANVAGFPRNFHIWFTKSLTSMSELISSVRGAHSFAPLQYCNLTLLHDYTVVKQYPVFGRGENEIVGTPEVNPPVFNVGESDAVSETGTDEDIEDISEEHYEVYEEQVQQELGVITGVESPSDAPQSMEVLNSQSGAMIESDQSLQLAEAGNLDAKESKEDDADINLKNASEYKELLQCKLAIMTEVEQALLVAEVEKQAQEDDANFSSENLPGLDLEASEIHIDVHGAGNVDANQRQENDAKFNVDKQSNIDLKHWRHGLDSEVAETYTQVYDDETAERNSATMDAANRGNEQRLEATDISPFIVLYLLLCVGAALIATEAFNWSRKGKSRRKRVTSSMEQPSLLVKELHTNTFQANKPQISPEKPSLMNSPIEMDMLEEPCSSEMSSVQKSSSSNSQKAVKQFNEAHSLEKKRNKNYRRESLASSSDYSMGSSTSYGSLTVYEKIPSKQGHGDEGTVTPVRRSSRIRNLATSPL